MWILVDVSNGDALEISNAEKLYWWQFESYATAVRHQKASKEASGARLVGPFEVTQIAHHRGGLCFKGERQPPYALPATSYDVYHKRLGILNIQTDVHTEHCCSYHGHCKYGKEDVCSAINIHKAYGVHSFCNCDW